MDAAQRTGPAVEWMYGIELVRRGRPFRRKTMRQFNPTAILTTLAIVLFPVLAADARGQQLLEIDGIELHGEAQLVMSGGGTCNVLESDTSYEAKKEHQGAPMDIWRLDFSVRNGSGRWLDHLIARYQIESAWPDCTNWDGPDAGTFAQDIEWADSIGNIQESGRNVVSPGQTLTETKFFIVLRGDPDPRFSNWSMDFNFAAAPAAAGAGSPAAPPAQQAPPAPPAELDGLFWQSIMESTNPAEFEAYLAQFPNGCFGRWPRPGWRRCVRRRAIDRTPASVRRHPAPGRRAGEMRRVVRARCFGTVTRARRWWCLRAAVWRWGATR